MYKIYQAVKPWIIVAIILGVFWIIIHAISHSNGMAEIEAQFSKPIGQVSFGYILLGLYFLLSFTIPSTITIKIEKEYEADDT